MKRVLVKLLILLVVLIGIAWAVYPSISNTAAQGNVSALMDRYHQTVRGMTAEQIEQILQDAAAYNEAQTGEGIPDVFSGQNGKTGRSYQNLMNIREGVIGEMVIPGIGVSLPIYHSGEGAGARERLIHVAGSALPADQDGTHTVLAGPGIQKAAGFLGDLRLTDGRMLEDLERILPKDLIFLNILDRTLIYQVEGVRTLAPEGLAAESMAGEEEAQLLTVLTEQKGRRLLIRARRVEAAAVRDQLIAEDRAEVPADVINILALGIPVLLLGLIVMTVIERFKKRSYRLPTEQKEQKERKKDWPEDEPAEEETRTEENKPER